MWILGRLYVLYFPFFLLATEPNGEMQTNGVTHGASDSSAGKGSQQVKGSTLILKQFYALLVKRFHHAIRSQKDFIAQVQRCSCVLVHFSDASSCTAFLPAVLFILDHPSCQFCPHSPDLHYDCPSIWRVSQSDSDPLDVRTTADLLQVRPLALQKCLRNLQVLVILLTCPSLFSNERPLDPKMRHFTERLLHSPGLGTRCMEGEPLG